METFILIVVIFLLINTLWSFIPRKKVSNREIEHLMYEIKSLKTALSQVEKQIFILNSTRHSEYKEKKG